VRVSEQGLPGLRVRPASRAGTERRHSLEWLVSFHDYHWSVE
jgi:hypothetical protein